MKNESTTVNNVDTNSDINAFTYNDFTGFLANDFPPVTTRTNLFSDNILYNMLKHLEDTGEYSRDIQNINIDDKYRLKINDWKKWITYNKLNRKDLEKSMQFKYMDLFNNIQENTHMDLLSRINIFLNERQDINDILSIEKKFMITINKFRKQYAKLGITDTDMNNAIYDDMNVFIKALGDIKSILWKKGSKTTISLFNVGSLYNKDSKMVSNSIALLRSFEKDFKKFVDDVISINDDKLTRAVIKDINELRKYIKNSKSTFWTKPGDISMIWSNTFDYLGM